MRAGTTTEVGLAAFVRPTGQLHLILEALPVGVFIADINGEMVFINSAARAIWHGQALSRSIDQYSEYRGWRPDTGELIRPEEWGLARAITHAETSVETVDIERFDGSKGTILNSAAPIIADDRLVGGIVAIQDVTDQRDRQRLGEALHHLATLLATVSDRQQLLIDAMPVITHALGVDGALGGFAKEGDYEITATYRFPDQFVGVKLTSEQIRAAEIAMQTGEPVAINDSEHDSRVNPESVRRFGIKSSLLIPFFDATRRVGGGMMFCHTAEAVPFNELQMEFARNVTAMASLFLQNDGLLRDRQEAVELRERLASLAAVVASTLQYDEMLGRVVAETAKAVGADSGMLLMLEDGRWAVRHLYNLPTRYLGRSYEHEAMARALQTAMKGKPVIIENAHDDQCVGMRDLIDEGGIESMLEIPIVVDQRVVSCFSLHLHSKDRSFTQRHSDFAEGAAAQVVAAVRNARTYERERQISENLQEALLVLPRNIRNVRFGQAYRAASEAARVGGDFYDLVQIDENRVALVIGDVSGKGLEAARMMMTSKNAVRAYLFAGMSPSQALTLTNDLVYGLSEAHQFVTLFVGILDGCTGRLDYSSAGHLPALVLHPDGKLRALVKISPLLGAFPSGRFEETEERLNLSDVLVMYTDGVVEARSPSGGMFGDQRLFELLRRSDGRAESLAQEVLAEVERFSGDRLSDDVAVLTASPSCATLPG